MARWQDLNWKVPLPYENATTQQEDVDNIEATHNVVLPQAYTETLLQHDSIDLTFPNSIDIYEPDYYCYLGDGFCSLLSLSDTKDCSSDCVNGMISRVFTEYDVPARIIPFGAGPSVEFMCFDYRQGYEEPSVVLVSNNYVYDNTGLSTLSPLAKDFPSFIRMIYDDELADVIAGAWGEEKLRELTEELNKRYTPEEQQRFMKPTERTALYALQWRAEGVRAVIKEDVMLKGAEARGVELPSNYVTLMLKHHGMAPWPGRFGVCYLNTNLYRTHRVMRMLSVTEVKVSGLPERIWPFGQCEDGKWLCFDYREICDEKNQPTVMLLCPGYEDNREYFVHDLMLEDGQSALLPVAKAFDIFMGMLY